ncbi:hypothetical protein [Dongia mobilis]|jgi:hypothetical protein|uniref:hypothetical protein n=1 Tax=Dongia sp. TaxID=1977262 RepID=UPI0026EA1FFB
MTAEQPSLRQVLRSIGRIIADSKAPGPADSGAALEDPGNDPGNDRGKDLAKTLVKNLGNAPIVAKLTTPLGKAQRNNFLVMALLALDVVLGATFGLVGYFGLQSDSIALTGAVMATVGVLLMLFYQLFGRER